MSCNFERERKCLYAILLFSTFFQCPIFLQFFFFSIPRCEGPSPLIIQGDVSKEEDCCRCPHCIDALPPQIHSFLSSVFPGRKCYLKKKIIRFFVLISLSLGLLHRLWKNLADWMCWYFDFIFSAEIARTMLGLQVNNAGVLEMGTIETTSLEQYDR